MSKLNTKHLMFILSGAVIIAMKTYPTIFSVDGQRDTWIAVLISGCLILCFLIFILWVCRKKNCFNIYQIYRSALGKVAGTAFYLLFMFTILLNAFESTAIEANVMHNGFLIQDQPWIFLILSTIAGVYIVKKGGASVVTTSLIAITMISISGIILSILTAKYKDFTYLLPIFEHGINGRFLLSVLKLLGSFGCVSIIFPYLNDLKDSKKIIKHSVIGLIFVIQIEVVAMTGSIMTFDVQRMNTLIYPKLTQTQLISYFSFLEAGELFVMLQVIAGWFMKFVITLFAVMLTLNLMNIKNKYITYGFGALSFVAAFLASSNLFSLFHFLNVLVYIELVNFVVVPLIVFIIFLLINRDKTEEPDEPVKVRIKFKKGPKTPGLLTDRTEPQP